MPKRKWFQNILDNLFYWVLFLPISKEISEFLVTFTREEKTFGKKKFHANVEMWKIDNFELIYVIKHVGFDETWQ